MYRWRGKRVTEKQYFSRLTRQANGAKRRKYSAETCSSIDSLGERDGSHTPAPEDIAPGEGRRIVELKLLAEQMWCTFCKECLSFENIEEEIRCGLCSIFRIRCHKCLLIREVSTSKSHFHGAHSLRYDVNTKSALGALHSGLGWTQIDKFLSCLNIPCYDFKTFKRYENEVGPAAETVAKTSCENATQLEREMTIENTTDIQTSLPEEYREGFVIKKTSENLTEEATDESPSATANSNVSFDDVVRLMVSYDMGWSTRGSGRSYDSLNGFGAIVGHFSGMVLDYSTCNRQCSGCGGEPDRPRDNCRLNFHGSAKAMEPHVGKRLVVESEILKSKNTQVGILIGDDDSSTIAACRNASDHPILKQSDKNHASGGVKKQLYEIQKNSKELTKEGINYLHRCFTYAVSQNKGNSSSMATAIRSIPLHAFNDHSICGTWCGYHEDEENYDHSTVPGGFTDSKLCEELKKIFDKLADNAEKFSLGASSNRNESLNATMASKAPKSRCYSRSASADYRFACAVGQKNLGEEYTQQITNKMTLSPGKHHSRQISRCKRLLLRRRRLINSHQFKRRRAQLKKIRAALRHRRENYEGLSYESNCGLLTQSAAPEASDEECDEGNDISEISVILFDLETSSLRMDCDILQIAAKCGSKEFSIYITPKQQVSPSATAVNGLLNCNGTLMLHGKVVESSPMEDALSKFIQWMESFEKQCCLAAHNLRFDGPRLINAMEKYDFDEKLVTLIYGFIDTLPVIKKATGRKGKGQCSLGTLAESLNIVAVGAHNAIYDCQLLAKVLKRIGVTNDILVENAVLYREQQMYWKDGNTTKSHSSASQTPAKSLSIAIRKKLASASISTQNLSTIHASDGPEGVRTFLQEKILKKEIRIQRKTIGIIIEWIAKVNPV